MTLRTHLLAAGAALLGLHMIPTELQGDEGMWLFNNPPRALLKDRYGLQVEIPVEQHEDVFIPLNAMTQIEGKLRDGDFVNVLRGV